MLNPNLGAVIHTYYSLYALSFFFFFLLLLLLLLIMTRDPRAQGRLGRGLRLLRLRDVDGLRRRERGARAAARSACRVARPLRSACVGAG